MEFVPTVRSDLRPFCHHSLDLPVGSNPWLLPPNLFLHYPSIVVLLSMLFGCHEATSRRASCFFFQVIDLIDVRFERFSSWCLAGRIPYFVSVRSWVSIRLLGGEERGGEGWNQWQASFTGFVLFTGRRKM